LFDGVPFVRPLAADFFFFFFFFFSAMGDMEGVGYNR